MKVINIKIKYLAENKQYLSTIAHWIYKEFVEGIRPTVTVNQIEGILQLVKTDSFPITLLAIENDKCVGTVSIFKNDLKSLDYTPWLGSLYVDKQYRGKGIAKLLINRVIDITKDMGYSILYLRTEHAATYYTELGWKYFITTKDDVGQITEVFTYDLKRSDKYMYKVIENRKSEFENPVKISKGEKITILEESNPNGDWPNWVLCKTHDNEGWIPKQIIDIDGNSGIITEDYDATEFDIVFGEKIIGEKELNGWIWGYKEGEKNKKAWAPLNCLERV